MKRKADDGTKAENGLVGVSPIPARPQKVFKKTDGTILTAVKSEKSRVKAEESASAVGTITAIVGDSRPLDLSDIYGSFKTAGPSTSPAPPVQSNLAEIMSSLAKDDVVASGSVMEKPLSTQFRPLVPIKPKLPCHSCSKCVSDIIPIKNRVFKLEYKVKNLIDIVRHNLKTGQDTSHRKPLLPSTRPFGPPPLKSSPIVIKPKLNGAVQVQPSSSSLAQIGLHQKYIVRSPGAAPLQSGSSTPSTSANTVRQGVTTAARIPGKIVFERTETGLQRPRFVPNLSTIPNPSTVSDPNAKVSALFNGTGHPLIPKTFVKPENKKAIAFEAAKTQFIRTVLLHPESEFHYGEFVKKNPDATQGLTKKQIESILTLLSDDGLLYQEDDSEPLTGGDTVWQKETSKSKLGKLKKYGIHVDEYMDTLN